MRIVCVHPSRDPVSCGQGPVHVGSAPDDAVVLTGAGVEPHHLTFVADARGLVLTVRAGCQRVYVNARAVREQALLHFGDTVTLGSSKFLVTSDTPPGQPSDAGDAACMSGQVALRVVSGPASGQALPVAPEIVFGAGSALFGDIPYACRVMQVDGALGFEAESAAPRINGWRCSHARLSHDDQIVLGEHRLVVEAPALQYAAHVVDLPQPVVPAPEPVPEDSPHAEVWWLIVAAAVLAALIALFLYFRW